MGREEGSKVMVELDEGEYYIDRLCLSERHGESFVWAETLS